MVKLRSEMEETRVQELFSDLYSSSKRYDSWQRYAMIRELRDLMRQTKGGQFRDGADDDDETWTEHNSVMEDETDLLEDESMPQSKVPVSDLEHGLRIHNASSIVCEDSQYVVGCDESSDHQKSKLQVSHVKKMEEFPHQSTNGNGENVAHQVFGKKSQHETLGIKKKTEGFKCWRFKFKQRKQRRGKLRSAHKLIHKGDVMENDHVHAEGLPLWLLVRFRFWKFKFINRKLQKVMREQGIANHLKLMYDKGEHDELFIMARTANVRGLLGVGVKQLTLAAKKFYLKHKWRSRLLQSSSELKQRIIMSLWKSLGYLMEDMMEEDQKQQGDSELLVIVPDVDTKVELVWESNSLVFHFKRRVWDPGRSLIKDSTPREFPFHSTATISFSLLFFLSRLTCKFSSLQTLRTRFL